MPSPLAVELGSVERIGPSTLADVHVPLCFDQLAVEMNGLLSGLYISAAPEIEAGDVDSSELHSGSQCLGSAQS